MKYITDIIVGKLTDMTISDIHTDYSDAEKKCITEYFGKYNASLFTSAPVIDAFTGKQVYDADNGYSDGEYTWYQSEMYYFEHYGLKLSKDFINHVMKALPPTPNIIPEESTL